MKKILIMLGMGCLCFLPLEAQEKTDAMLFGDVKSKTDQSHIPYATVSVKKTRYGTLADASGHYKLSNLPLGRCIIVAQAIGYKTVEKEVEMQKSTALNLFFELEEDVFNLEQVVVTATRTRHFVKDVPVRTEVLTARALEVKNAHNLFQALEGMPGIRVENQCQYCNFTMVRMQGLGAEHTQILINGQPMYSGLAGVYGLQQLSIMDVGQIEVIKGAGSALYGSSAVAGAINIITKDPDYDPIAKVDLQVGNHHTHRYGFSGSIRNAKGNAGLSLYAQKYMEGAIDETGPGTLREEVRKQDGISDRVASDLTNLGMGLFLHDLLLDGDKLVFRAKSVAEKREGGILIDEYYKNPFTDGTENIETNRHELEMNYKTMLSDRAEMNFLLAYVNHKRNATNDSYLKDYMDTHQQETPDVLSMRPYLAKEHTVTSTLTFSQRLGNHNLLLGVQSYFDDLEESGMYVVVNPESPYLGASYRSISDKSAREAGVFIQDEWNVSSRLVFVPGVRVDYHHSRENYSADRQVSDISIFPSTGLDKTSVNPRFALKYTFSPKLTLRFNAGTGYRAPYGFSEDLHLCSGSPRVWKSSDLNPETAVSYNFSADYYENQWRASINVFRTDLRNKIGFTDSDPEIAALGYDYQWKNIDDAFVQGVELSLMASFLRDLEVGLDLTYNQGEYNRIRSDWKGTAYEKDSKYISRFPRTTGNLRLEFSPGTWNFTLMGNYQGQMYIDYYNGEVDPAVGDRSKIKKTHPNMLFNARISKEIGHVKWYAGINNILDYVQDEKYLDDAAFIYAPVYGRQFYTGISFDIH